MYELSLLGGRMVIAAHIMGLDSYCITEVLSNDKTKQVVKEFENNYELLYPKIVLEEMNNRYRFIRLRLKETDPEVKEEVTQEEEAKQRLKIQNDFIQRNYYAQLRREVHNS
jgi:phosphoglycerol transferase MdoB-like AlkP superfamily enzyme